MAFQRGDVYRLTEDGKAVFSDLGDRFEFLYATARAVMLGTEAKGHITVSRSTFSTLFQEVKPRGRKTASSK